MFGALVTTIRTTPFPQAPNPAVTPDAGKMAAQRAFFAALAGKTAATAAEAAAAPAAAAPTAAPAPRVAVGAEPPAKILRPGSIIDIRV
jgi:hypothetical protein